MYLSREQAENLIQSSQILSSQVKQSTNEIQIHLQLSESETFIITYDRLEHKKSYKIDKN